jgi:hypothetical protein
VSIPTYTQGSDLPDYAVQWLDQNGDLIDFSTGWTFQCKVGTPGAAAAITKSTGITGASTSPNVSVEFATTAELNTLTPGTYTVQIKATRTSDSRDRYFRGKLRVVAAIS